MSDFQNIFHNDTVTVLRISKGTGYERSETAETLCTIKGDLQPYSGGLARESYGLDVECQKRLYFDACNNIKPGAYVEVNNVRYRVEYAEERNMGSFALLKEENTGG